MAGAAGGTIVGRALQATDDTPSASAGDVPVWVTASTASPTPSPSATSAGPVTASPVAPQWTIRAGKVRAKLQAYIASRGGHMGIAVVDRMTGAQVSVQSGPPVITASVVKVEILAELLRQARLDGRSLSGWEDQLAHQMIIQSDNDAATTLWRLIGGTAGLARANRAFGLRQTSPGEADYWGLTTTTAVDQVRLLRTLSSSASPLQGSDRGYLFSLMSKVSDSQDWGITDASSAHASAEYVKNGWLATGPVDRAWTINSIGRLVEPGHDWLIAVMSDHNESMGSGMTSVAQAARIAVVGLRAA